MKILLADDHPLILHGTKSYLESIGYQITDVCSNGTSAFNLIKLIGHDLAILDISMAGMSGIEVARKVQESRLSCRIILLTMHNEREIYEKAQSYGIYGYLLKVFSSEELDTCIQTVMKGDRYLSPYLEKELVVSINENDLLNDLNVTEQKIIELIALQKTSKQIGDLLFISEKTVEWHRSNIIVKLGLPKEKNVLMKWAIQHFA